MRDSRQESDVIVMLIDEILSNQLDMYLIDFIFYDKILILIQSESSIFNRFFYNQVSKY